MEITKRSVKETTGEKHSFGVFFNQLKWRCNLDIHLKGLVMIYEIGAEEMPITLRWFISAKYH